jgi:hypothetical protein
MLMDEIKLPDRERDEATIKLLIKLQKNLLSDHVSTARVSAFHLAWLQEDGLFILKEVMFGNYSRTAKKAAAYGLRKMQGRMKKLALEVLENGVKSRDYTTQAACIKSLELMEAVTAEKKEKQEKLKAKRRKIMELPPKSNKSTESFEKRSSHRSKREG